MSQYNRLIFKKMIFIYGHEKAILMQKQRKALFFAAPLFTAVISIAMFLSGKTIILCVFAFLGLAAGFYILYDGNIMKKAKHRCLQMRLELSELLDRLAVLLDAGVTLWNSIVIVSENSVSGGAFEAELKKTVNAFYSQDGYYFDPESAFEEMALRCDDATVSTFVSLIVQNSRKGTSELAELLRIQAVNSRNERRMLAKQLSDEASTLMLIPSALILASILILVAAPAVIQFL